MGTGFWVDIEELRYGATRAAAIAAALDASATITDSATPDVIAAHPGFGAAGALRSCAKAWRERLKRTRENVERIGSGLKGNAAAYEMADQDAAARISRILADLGG